MCFSRPLFVCEDPVTWRQVYSKYWQVVELKSRTSKNKKAGTLLTLDKWYQEELPVAVASRAERFLTRSELLKVMEWKLTRGKFRPRLQQLVATNPSETVEICTKKAFSLLPDVQAAITELCSLKALGPATASAVLAAGAPELAAFMADEAVEAIPGLKPIQYTAKHYSLYLQRVVERADMLNKAMCIVDGGHTCCPFTLSVDCKQNWTPHRVELCLWAWAVASQLQPSLLQDLKEEDSTEDRLETNQKPAKRQKTM